MERLHPTMLMTCCKAVSCGGKLNLSSYADEYIGNKPIREARRECRALQASDSQNEQHASLLKGQLACMVSKSVTSITLKAGSFFGAGVDSESPSER